MFAVACRQGWIYFFHISIRVDYQSLLFSASDIVEKLYVTEFMPLILLSFL